MNEEEISGQPFGLTSSVTTLHIVEKKGKKIKNESAKQTFEINDPVVAFIRSLNVVPGRRNVNNPDDTSTIHLEDDQPDTYPAVVPSLQVISLF